MVSQFLKKFKKNNVILPVLLLLGTSFFHLSQLVEARVVQCVASTTDLTTTGYQPIVSISSSTNATVGDSGTYSLKIYCDGNVSRSYANASGTCATLTTVPIFSYEGITGPPDNSHIGPLQMYPNELCVASANNYNFATTSVQGSSCGQYGTTFLSVPASFSTDGNSHAGDADAYSTKICLTYGLAQVLSVSYSTNSVGLGSLSPGAVVYASTDGSGTSTATSSLSINVSTQGNFDYAVSVQGDTLKNMQDGTVTIPPIGLTPASLVAGSDQFGIYATSTCLSAGTCTKRPTLSSTYNTSGSFAFPTSSSSPSLIATGQANDTSAAFQDGTRYLITFGATIPSNKPAGTYSSNIVFVVTSTF